MEEFGLRDEEPQRSVSDTPEQVVELYNLDEYRGEIETYWWIPDKSKPEKKIRLDLRVQLLKGGDKNYIIRQMNEVNQRGPNINHLQRQLQQLKPSYEVERLEKKLSNMSRLDFDGDDAYDTARKDIQDRIEKHMADYKAEYESIETKLKALADAPSFYETLRVELFNKVIADHTIGVKSLSTGMLAKVDFSISSPDHELPDAFAADLQAYIFDVLQRGKASKRNGSSRK